MVSTLLSDRPTASRSLQIKSLGKKVGARSIIKLDILQFIGNLGWSSITIGALIHSPTLG